MKPFVFSISLLFFATVAAQKSRPNVDFITGAINIRIHPDERKVVGSVTYTVNVLEHIDFIAVDAKDMAIASVRINGKKQKYSYDNVQLRIFGKFKKDHSHTVKIQYSAYPKQAMYFLNWDNTSPEKQVWTQGQGKESSHWVPSIDNPNEKIIFSNTVTFGEDYTVISNGELQRVSTKDSLKVWSYAIEKPMSSYLLAIVAGKFLKQTIHSKRKIPIELYYPALQDTTIISPTYRYTQKIFDYFEEEIGIPYPWKIYRNVPLRDFLHGGMENTTVTTFGDVQLIDTMRFRDQNYVNINAHEMAHHWFGNLVTAKKIEDGWLQEGFATYYALLAEREIYGDDHYYWELYQIAQKLFVGDFKPIESTSPESFVAYQKAALVLHLLREHIGDTAFREGVKNYLLQFYTKNVSTADLVDNLEHASDKDLNGFVNFWIKGDQIDRELIFESFKKNSFLSDFMTMVESTTPKDSKLDNANFYPLSVLTLEKSLQNASHEEAVSLWKKALAQKNTKLSLLALNFLSADVQKELTTELKELLSQKESYNLAWAALVKLCSEDPKNCPEYLELTKGLKDSPNHIFRINWISWAIANQNPMSAIYETELVSYTGPEYSYLTRMYAFDTLQNTSIGLSKHLIENLLQACTHFHPEFRKFANKQLDELLKQNPQLKTGLKSILPSFHKTQQEFLKSKLGL